MRLAAAHNRTAGKAAGSQSLSVVQQSTGRRNLMHSGTPVGPRFMPANLSLKHGFESWLPQRSTVERLSPESCDCDNERSKLWADDSIVVDARAIMKASIPDFKLEPTLEVGDRAMSCVRANPHRWTHAGPPPEIPGFRAAHTVHESPLQSLWKRTSSRTVSRCSAALLILCSAIAAAAVEPSLPLENMGRQAWVVENGLPQNTVEALAQTRDGFVWVGTEAGLARFDGVSFQTFDRNSTPALPGSDIRCLLSARDGGLWIGTNAGLARWKDGVVTAFTTNEGLPANGIIELREDEEGKIVLWTDQGIARQAGDRFAPVRNVDAYPHTALPSPGEYPGAVLFEEPLPDGIFVMGGRASLDFMQGASRLRLAFHLAVGRELPGNRIQVVFADREGALWIGTNGGLARWVKGKVERFSVTDPLATASILAIMEDREGSLWVGTESNGLHILRNERFLAIGAREGLSSDATTAVVEDSSATLWVGTEGEGLNAVPRNGETVRTGAVRHYSVSEGLASNVILSLAAAPNGDLWVGTPDGLSRIRSGTVTTYTSADGLPDDFIRSLLVDSDGSLWIGTRHGLAHWSNAGGTRELPAHIEIYTEADGLGSDLVGATVRDKQGDLWIATLAGIARLHGGKLVNFTTGNGLSSNVITALWPRDDGSLLIGTQDRGWDVWDGRSFFAVVGSGVDQMAVHAILDDDHGHLWFATGNGIERCDYSATGESTPGSVCGDWMEFSASDGLPSHETATNAHPSAWRSRDGHLWFATPKGLVEVDPAHFAVNSIPPPVVLARFAIDDVDQPLQGAGQELQVKAGHVHFEFDYAGLSFIAPQKVRYRFMLEGFDHRWTEAGSRRAAYYTNIPPGKYTFRVQAANNDGIWNTTGAAFKFELEPHFYQTAWFYLLLLTVIAAAVLVSVRLRLRQAEGEFRAVLGERSRIAREIHDTLAQGYVGISAHLEVLAELLRQGKAADAAKQLDMTRGYVREGLAEARQSIWALRTQDSRETTLPVKLRRIVEAVGVDGLETRFSTFGAYRPLPGQTEQELLRIAQEAIHNVKKHAGASQLFVQLEFGPDTVDLEVRDNGRGGVVDQASDSTQGHFGLTGMRERAAAIGGTLEVESVPGQGTVVRLHAAAPSALMGERS